MARVACETAIKTGFVLLAGEITTTAFVDFDKLVRQVVIEIGFDDSSKGFRRPHLRRYCGHWRPEPGHCPGC